MKQIFGHKPLRTLSIRTLVLATFILYPTSGFALPTLPDASNLLYWFSADTDVWSDSAATTAAADGVDVQLWRDQITALDVSPPTTSTSRSPTYIANGIGNQPSLDFNTGDGGMDALLSTNFPPSVTANTLFIVFQPENEVKTQDSSQALIDAGSGVEVVGLGAFHYSVGQGVVGISSKRNTSSVVGVGFGPAKLSAGQPHLLTAVYNTATQVFDLYLDGVNAGNTRTFQNPDTNGFVMQDLAIGARLISTLAGFEGMISEMIFYQSSLSNADRIEVQNYLSHKYLVPTTNMAFRFSADSDTWKDANATIPATDGDNVELWQDQSGNNFDLQSSQPGTDRTATFIANGINGQPALQFNNETGSSENASDVMQHNTYSGTLKTLFYVFQPDQAIGSSTTSSLRQTLLSGNSEISTVGTHSSVSAAHIGLESSDGSALQAWGYDPIDSLDIPAYPSVLSISWHDADDQYDIRINGASVGNLASGVDPDAFAMSGLYIGANSSETLGFQGKIAEIIAYDVELPTPQRDAIEQYLKGKYTAPNTFYVDATSGDDEESGLSPSSAWTSLERIEDSLLIPGDTILLKRGETWREHMTVPASGAAGLPITFRAYGSGAKPIIHGGRPGTEPWSAPDENNIYTIENQTNLYFIAEDNELLKYASDASCTDGNWFRDGIEENVVLRTGTIYYKPTTGIITDHNVDLVTTYTAMRIVGKSYLNFEDLTFTLVARGIYGNAAAPNAIGNINISDSEFLKTKSGVFFLSAVDLEHSDTIISDNLFTNNQQPIGIYAAGNGVGTNRNILITRNTMLNAGIAAYPQIWSDFSNGDAEGIGLQNMSDSVISHNRLIDGFGITTGIGMWVNENSTGRNTQYIYNYMENIAGAGFVPSGAYNTGGHTVAYNIIINAGVYPLAKYPGKRWGAIKLNANQDPPSKIYNNLLIGNDISIYIAGGPNHYEIYNNISYEPLNYHAFLYGAISSNTMDNNLYYPDASNSFGGHVHIPTNLAGWQGTGYSFGQDADSIVGNPNFVNSSEPYDFHLTANSPAIDPTLNVQTALGLSNNYLDYDDQFMLWNPDIGPYEYQLTDTDADGVLDMTEICYDGNCSDYDPYDATTNPSGGDLNANAVDTDSDGTNDGAEIAAGTDPLNSASGAATSAVSAPVMGLVALIMLSLGFIGFGFRLNRTSHS